MNVRELKRLIEHMDEETVLWVVRDPGAISPVGRVELLPAQEDACPSLLIHYDSSPK